MPERAFNSTVIPCISLWLWDYRKILIYYTKWNVHVFVPLDAKCMQKEWRQWKFECTDTVRTKSLQSYAKELRTQYIYFMKCIWTNIIYLLFYSAECAAKLTSWYLTKVMNLEQHRPHELHLPTNNNCSQHIPRRPRAVSMLFSQLIDILMQSTSKAIVWSDCDASRHSFHPHKASPTIKLKTTTFFFGMNIFIWTTTTKKLREFFWFLLFLFCSYLITIDNYLAKSTQNIILIILIGIITNSNQRVQSTKRNKTVHQIFIILKDLLQRE